MKKIAIITSLFLSSGVLIISCHNKRDPGRIYMPDMTYSRAYESYAERDSATFTTNPLKKGGNMIFYNNIPVNGTIKRGELFPYTLPNDSNGYNMSATVKNPFDSLKANDLAEAGRLYNINCAICHGATGAANGLLATGGYIGGVANLTQPAIAALSDGTMFHVMTYGKNNMGSYASQLSRQQRWMIVKYIRTLQPKASAAPATAATATTAATDSTAAKTAMPAAGK